MKTTAKRPLVDANPLYKVLVLHLQKTCFLERRGTFPFAYIFVLHGPRFKRSPEVSRSLRHLIFIRSRKQCRANRCQLRHSGFWLSSQIIAGGNRCLANKLRMNHLWEGSFSRPRKDCATCAPECPAWQLLGKVSSLLSAMLNGNYFFGQIFNLNKLYVQSFVSIKYPSWSLFRKIEVKKILLKKIQFP